MPPNALRQHWKSLTSAWRTYRCCRSDGYAEVSDPARNPTTEAVDEAIKHNAAHLAERGPALSYAYRSYVLARDPEHGMILLGGLGSMGIGRLWFIESDYHPKYPGYTEAAIQECPEDERRRWEP